MLNFVIALNILACINGATTHVLNWDASVGDQGTLYIQKGDTVQWNWTDSKFHSVDSLGYDSSDNEFTSSSVETGLGHIYEVTFEHPGSFPYQCSVHNSMMGTIEVFKRVVYLDWDASVGDQGEIEAFPDDTVIWTWTDEWPHTVSSIGGNSFPSSALVTQEGYQYAVTFENSGKYYYDCVQHPSMTGYINVEKRRNPVTKFEEAGIALGAVFGAAIVGCILYYCSTSKIDINHD